MKKVLSLMIISLVAILPFVVKADTSISPSCSKDANGVYNCTINYNITDAAGVDSMTVTLTEQGGADITDITTGIDSDWTISSKNELNGVWTVILAAPSVSGEGNLFSFSYVPSGEIDCKVLVALNGVEKLTITPDTDKVEENKDTGSTLPYIALGSIALIAAGAYVATRNKSKVYKI